MSFTGGGGGRHGRVEFDNDPNYIIVQWLVLEEKPTSLLLLQNSMFDNILSVVPYIIYSVLLTLRH